MNETTTHPPGADLHLGGNAYAHPLLQPLLVPIEEVTPWPGNPRRHDQDAITDSVRDHGLYAPINTQVSSGHVILGHGRLQALVDLDATHVPVLPMDKDDAEARLIVARDNRTHDLGGYDDADQLAILTQIANDGVDLWRTLKVSDEELAELRALVDQGAGLGEEGIYTRKADAIQYVPLADEPPPVEALVDRTKANDLMRQITAAELPPEVRDFLVAGAQRHLVFNYAQIAEYYCHADPVVQALMEASALVIIDFEDAMENGFVRLSDRLRVLLDLDKTERDTLAEAGIDA